MLNLLPFVFSLDKCDFFKRKICHFSGRLRPDWLNTAWAAMGRLGSVGLRHPEVEIKDSLDL